jgi:BASS family bile acid:Na+ symporter
MDALMIVGALAGLFCGVVFDHIFIFIAPYAVVLVGFAQFLSLMPVKVLSLFKINRKQAGEIALWAFLKLLALPLLLLPLTWLFEPRLTGAMTMAGGTATAVLAPLIAGILRGDIVRVMQVVMITSLIMPFSLPLLVWLTSGAYIEFDLTSMGLLLGLAIIIPSLLVVMVRRYLPAVAVITLKTGPLLGRLSIFFTAAALISPCAQFVRNNFGYCMRLTALSWAAVLFSALLALAAVKIWKLPAVTGVLTLSFCNFGLAAVTSSHFLDTDSTVLIIGFLLPSILPIPILRMRARARLPKPAA